MGTSWRLLVRTAFALLALASGARAASGVPGERWLWGHVETSMGLGDQLHFHHALLLLARGTQRTAVLPPLQITVTDWSAIAAEDPTAGAGAAFDAAVARATEGRVRHSANFPRVTRQVPVEEWFDTASIAAAAGVRIATFDEWRQATGARTTRTLVPARTHGCLPSWEAECAKGTPPDRTVSCNDRPVELAGIDCVATTGAWDGAADGEVLLARLGDDASRAADTLALDGFCLRLPLPAALEALRPSVARGFRLAAGVRAKADAWRKRHGLARYAAVHWRRGDLLVDHYDEVASQTPARLGAAVADALRGRDTGPLDGLVLLTDAFSRPELARAQDALRAATGLRVLRYDSEGDTPGDAASESPAVAGLPSPGRALEVAGDGAPGEAQRDVALARPFDAEREFDRTVMDLALGGDADVLMGSSPGSNFFTLMALQRDDRVVVALPMAWGTVK